MKNTRTFTLICLMFLNKYMTATLYLSEPSPAEYILGLAIIMVISEVMYALFELMVIARRLPKSKDGYPEVMGLIQVTLLCIIKICYIGFGSDDGILVAW